MIDSVYFKQAELLLRVLPFIDREAVFASKGGTAVNFFIRDLPRISIDTDLTYLPVGEREPSLQEVTDALMRISNHIEDKIRGQISGPKKSRERDS